MNTLSKKFPRTVETAVDKIMADISRRDQTRIANMNETKLVEFHINYGIYIKNELRLWSNEPLMEACKQMAGVTKLSPDQASYIILKELQERLLQSDILRVVK
ncbi:MAG: hypothetical protein JRF32_09135 [Deltaproteobacteria bacterium]|nr:hypothetical protein [Deltaproteobacteria bacterium]MBW2613135.1 hypothetical protein [Deltaproteobacteria bacterium]MBW2679059.1 hypothetical protein [Deltaproteobacteria bacterium]